MSLSAVPAGAADAVQDGETQGGAPSSGPESHFEPVPPVQPPPPRPVLGGIIGSVLAGPAPGSREGFAASAGSDTVYFGHDSLELQEEARTIIAEQAGWLVANPSVRVTVEGHADEPGTREHNLAIGERRAAAVRDYLVAHGVDAARISIISYGKERPVAVDADPAQRALNRRATTVIVE